MFRLLPCISKSTNTLLYRITPVTSHIPIEYSTKPRKIIRVHDQELCPKVPKPVPRKKTPILLYTLAALLLGAVGFVVYAKTDPELRDWVTVYFPPVDDALAIIYQENMTYWELFEYYMDFENKKEQKLKPCYIDGEGKPVVERGEGECVPIPLKLTDKDICEMEECVIKNGNTIVDNYKKSIEVSQAYNEQVQKAMGIFSVADISKLLDARTERRNIVEEKLIEICTAEKALEEINIVLEKSEPKSDSHNQLRQFLKDYRTRINKMSNAMKVMQGITDAYDAYFDAVYPVIEKFKTSNKGMFGIDFDSENPRLTHDKDLFFILQSRLINVMDKSLAENIKRIQDLASRVFDLIPEAEKEKATKKANDDFASEVAGINKKMADRLADVTKKLEEKQQAKLDAELEKMEKKHNAILERKTAEFEAKNEKIIKEGVAAGRALLEKELSEVKVLQSTVEKKLADITKVEKERSRATELWEAGSLILQALKKGDPLVDVNKPIHLLEKAGKNDKLVIVLLKSLPDSIRKHGVTPTSVLRGKYNAMEDVAMKVALVEAEGNILPIYWFSWLQSLLLFWKLRLIPQDEIENIPDEIPKDLDTFDLLQRARYWINRGRPSIAMRYVAEMKGASLAAARSWLRAANDHSQLKQAAEAIMAHATALQLNYITT